MNRRNFLKAAAVAAISAPALVKATQAGKSKYAVPGRHPEPKRYYVRWDDHAGSKGEMSSPDANRASIHFWTLADDHWFFDKGNDFGFRYSVTFHHDEELIAHFSRGGTRITPVFQKAP